MEKPEHGAHNITSYTVYYHSVSVSDHTDGGINNNWREHSAVLNEAVVLTDLSENTIYYFKIRPQYEGGVGTESDSDISECIKTEKRLTFKEAHHKLREARKKWYNIGLCLGIDREKLDVIKLDNQWNTDS